MQYSRKVMELINDPLNVGSLDEEADDVGTGVIGSPECGDVMKLQIRVGRDGRIVDAKFKTFGCGSAIAASSLATERIKGRTLEEAMQLTNRELAEELELPPIKVHCSVLAEQAVRAAVADYRDRHQARTSGEV
jgi:nitrogen fixation NifU-like protein